MTSSIYNTVSLTTERLAQRQGRWFAAATGSFVTRTLNLERLTAAAYKARAKAQKKELKMKIHDLRTQLIDNERASCGCEAIASTSPELENAFATIAKLQDEVSQLRNMETSNQNAFRRLSRIIARVEKKVSLSYIFGYLCELECLDKSCKSGFR